MSEKITSSSSSSLSQYKKTGRKKPLSGDNQKGKVAAEVKRDTSCPESGSAGEQVNYSPPVRDDNLNISNEAIHFMDGEGKGSEATLNEIMEKIFTQPEIDGKSSGKVELFLSAMKEGNDEKADISTLMEGTYEEIEIGKNAFRKLSGAGERNRDGDKTQCVSYDRPEMGKEDVYSLWDGEVSASGSASPEKEEKIPRTTDRERLHRESHNIMKKLDGRDRAEEETDTVMGGRTYKKYSTSEKDVDGGKEISFKENHETAYKDKEGNVKKDTSSSLITRNPDGSYNKVYERTDGDGNKYNTELKTNSDGSSERISRTLLNDGTEITSSETEDKEGRKKIISEETRPDGSKIYKERIVDEKGKGKVVMRETKPEGRNSNKERKTGESQEKLNGVNTLSIKYNQISKDNNDVLFSKNANQIVAKSVSFWDNIFPPDELKAASGVDSSKGRPSDKHIYPVFDIETKDGDKITVDTGIISDEARNLLGKPINRYLDPEISRDEKLVCIDVIDIAYKNSGIDILKTMQYAADNNIPGYETSSKDAYEDSWMVRRVPHWYKFFEDNGLLNKLGNNPEEFPEGKPYQTGDVLFIEHQYENTLPDGKKESYWLLDHSAIVTGIDPDTGLPREIVAASWPDNEIHKFTWEEWKIYLEKPDVKMSAYAGFREDTTLEFYKNPDYMPSD